MRRSTPCTGTEIKFSSTNCWMESFTIISPMPLSAARLKTFSESMDFVSAVNFSIITFTVVFVSVTQYPPFSYILG